MSGAVAAAGLAGLACDGRDHAIPRPDARADRGSDKSESEVTAPGDLIGPSNESDASPTDTYDAPPLEVARGTGETPDSAAPAAPDADGGGKGGSTLNGRTCQRDVECVSGHCREGVCCDGACSEKCVSCLKENTGAADGQCAPVKSGLVHGGDCLVAAQPTCGFDGTCDGKGSCRRYGAETICRGEQCVPGSSSYSPTSKCDGMGTCQPVIQSCGFNSCAPDGIRCRGGCNTDSECATNAYCNSKLCVARLPQESLCDRSEQCASGLCSGRCCKAGTPCTCTQPSKANLLKNAGFDRDSTSWTVFTATWSPADVEGCPFSGSLYAPAASGDPSQCVQITPGVKYNFGAAYRKHRDGVFTAMVVLMNTSDCTGDATVLAQLNDTLPGDETMGWMRAATEVQATSDSFSAHVSFDALKADLDQIYLTPAPGGY